MMTRVREPVPWRAGWVVATPAAEALISSMRVHDRINAVRQHGADVEGAELPAEPNEIQLGEIAGIPFLADRDKHIAAGCPNLHIGAVLGPDGHLLRAFDADKRCKEL